MAGWITEHKSQTTATLQKFPPLLTRFQENVLLGDLMRLLDTMFIYFSSMVSHLQGKQSLVEAALPAEEVGVTVAQVLK